MHTPPVISSFVCSCLFFFFQAEDGIRYLIVTGVQTCALPISKVEQSGARLDTLSANLTQLTTRLTAATGSLKTVLDKMEKGEGTLGKMATDTMLYRNLNETLTSLSALLKDLRERPGRYINVKVF